MNIQTELQQNRKHSKRNYHHGNLFITVQLQEKIKIKNKRKKMED